MRAGESYVPHTVQFRVWGPSFCATQIKYGNGNAVLSNPWTHEPADRSERLVNINFIPPVTRDRVPKPLVN